MSDYVIDITTEDLAYSLDRVTSSVDATNAAVNEMNGAVCAAEREAADEVCTNVNRGFFNLIHAQLLQKKVQVQATAESQLLTLRHFAQSLLRIKHQLGVDYQRITARYTKLFKSLADALQSRIYAVDRPAAEVADSEYRVLEGRVLNSGAPAVIVQQDAVSTAAELLTVRCKRDCQKVMEGVRDLIEHGTTLNRKIEGMVRDVHQEAPRSVYVPFVVGETADLFLAEGNQTTFALPAAASADTVMAAVKKACYEAVGRFTWTDGDGTAKSEVARRVRDRISGEIDNPRLGRLIMQLLEASDWQELEAVG